MAARVSDARILDATVAAIREHGIDGATTRDIAHRADINEITLFRRFGDKQQLVHAAVHEAMTRLGSDALIPSDDVRADLVEIVRYYAAAFDPTYGIALIMLTEASRHPAIASLLDEPAALLHRCGAVVRHHQQRGVLTAEPVGDALAALIGPLLIRSLSRRLDVPAFGTSEPDDDEDEPKRLVDRFLRGHGAPKGPN